MRGIEIRKFNVYRLRKLPEDKKFLKSPFNERSFIYRVVDKSNLENIISTRPEMYSEYKKFLEEGELGYYVYFENKVIACGWVFLNLKHDKIKKKYIVIPKGFAWLHHFWTHPDFRGYGIYPSLLTHICEDLLSQNKISYPKDILIDTSCTNIASNRGILKANFEFIGNILALRVRKYWIILRENYGKKILH